MTDPAPPLVMTLPPPPRPMPMTDREYVEELRRGLLLIIRATMRRYGLAWTDFLPKGKAVVDIDPNSV